MYPSLILCRAQEQSQRARANAATLDNVRRIANDAAAAWAREGLAAEKREDRKLRTIAFEAARHGFADPAPVTCPAS